MQQNICGKYLQTMQIIIHIFTIFSHITIENVQKRQSKCIGLGLA